MIDVNLYSEWQFDLLVRGLLGKLPCRGAAIRQERELVALAQERRDTCDLAAVQRQGIIAMTGHPITQFAVIFGERFVI